MSFEFLEINELRKLLDEKKVSSVELTEYFLARIKNLNPELNAYLTVTEDVALQQAREADDALHNLPPTTYHLQPLLGIPYAAKDLFCTQGIRTTASSKILDQFISPYDATVIKKLKAQNSVLLGKTNLDEFAHGSSTETSAYGPSKNPWDTTRMPGGSSGGSSSAVAAGIAPWALATETGGSIRQPSSLTGVSGWKPTYGGVSRYGVISMASSLDSIGAMAYSVADLALLAEVLSGQDIKDGTTGRNLVPQFSKNLNLDLHGVKVGVPAEYFIDPSTGSGQVGMDEDVKARVMDGIKQLEKLGADIVEVHLPNTKYGSLVYAIICPSEVSSNLARYDGIRFGHVSKEAGDLLEVYTKSRAEGFGIEAKRRILTGTYVLSAGYYDAYYKKAQRVRGLIISEFNDVFRKVDILACPSVPNVALTLGQAKSNPLFGYIADQLNIPSSLAGLPALSIPCGFVTPKDFSSTTYDLQPTTCPMPVGLQLIGPQWGDQKLFNVGYAFQQATDWHKQHPKI
ncbi:MAG: Asp-tRNA(Asn)/Glu-tRNA(Gln) amidotransferase subunit GatA [bacterium]|nr:Asp-tRNA(Asn)/Glu-tRNA(Gln) amidotransferase subunit GatA [bacterium]